MRPFRFVIHLREFGWQPTVLTIETPGQVLTDKEAKLLRDVRIIKVEAPFDLTARSESQLGAPDRRNRAGGHSRISRLVGALDRQVPIDSWMLLFAAKYRELLSTAVDVDPHAIWATGDPWSGLVLGRWLSKHLDVPFIPDFRDPWTLSEVRTDGQWSISHLIDRRSERLVVRSADVVMFQAQQVEAAYRRYFERFQPRTVTIRNSFDPVIFDDPIDVGERPPVRRGGDLNVGFFGRFRTMSPATLVVEVLSAMRVRHGAKTERVRIHPFGPLSEDDARYADRQGVSAQFIPHAAVPLQKALSVLREFDILLVSTDRRRERIIPAKLFEYLAAGRPILSLSRNPEVGDILQQTGTGVQMQDERAAADLLAACVDALDRGVPLPVPYEPDREEIMKHEARTTTGKLAKVLDELIGQRPVVSSLTG